jgi:predicted nucleotidyltransferase
MGYCDIVNREDVIARLRQHEADLKKMGVKSLYIFGSTARGVARPDSDVDLFYDYEKGTLGLLEVIGIEETASRILGCKADAMPREGINRYVRSYAEEDAVRVF